MRQDEASRTMNDKAEFHCREAGIAEVGSGYMPTPYAILRHHCIHQRGLFLEFALVGKQYPSDRR